MRVIWHTVFIDLISILYQGTSEIFNVELNQCWQCQWIHIFPVPICRQNIFRTKVLFYSNFKTLCQSILVTKIYTLSIR